MSDTTHSQVAQAHEGDFVTILSSEMIAGIVQAYFNDQMYKVPVVIVDLEPVATGGYKFVLAFEPVASSTTANGTIPTSQEEALRRMDYGRFPPVALDPSKRPHKKKEKVNG